MFSKLLDWDKKWLVSWNNLAESSGFLKASVKFTAQYLIYLLPIIFVILWFYSAQAKKVALRAVASAGLGLGITMIIGKSINRPRPFESGGVQEILFHRPDYSFPSDHTTVLVAIAVSFYLSGYKKLSYLMFILATIISVARIAAGVHYPSDILAGAVVGIAAAFIIKALDGPLEYVYQFIIGIARRLMLA
jgi:undecaprenyl-diphosphatase